MSSSNTPHSLFAKPLLPMPKRSALMQALNIMNVQSGDISQVVREFYRQLTVVPPDRSIDYMWRGVSVLPNAFLREITYRALRVFYSVPLFEAAMDMDRLDKQPYLKAFGIENPQAYVNISDYSTLRNRLTDDMYGSDYKSLPRLLREKDKHWANVYDDTLNKRNWKQVWVEADDPLVKHLDYWMDFRQMLTNLKELPGKLDHKLPYFEDATPAQVGKVVDTIKDSLDHMNKHTGLGSYLYRANNLFRDMAHGRYAINGRIDTASALFTLNKETGALGLKASFNKADTQLLKTLIGAVGQSKTLEPMLGAQQFKKEVLDYFSLYKAPHQIAQKALEKKYMNGGALAPEKVSALLSDLLSGKVTHKGKALSFSFDAGRFGLKPENIERFASSLSEEAKEMNQLLRHAAKELQAVNTPTEMQQLGKQLHHSFNERLLSLASVFPGKVGQYTGKQGSELMQESLKAGLKSPIGQLLTDGLRAESVMPKTLKQIASTSFWPQLAVSVVVTAFGFGTFRAWLDQQVVQPYQKKVVAQKGDVVGTIMPFGLGMAAGLATFSKIMSSSSVRSLLKNDYILTPVVATVASLAVQGALTVGTLIPLLNSKKDLPNADLKKTGDAPKPEAMVKKAELAALASLPSQPVWLPQKPSPWGQEGGMEKTMERSLESGGEAARFNPLAVPSLQAPVFLAPPLPQTPMPSFKAPVTPTPLAFQPYSPIARL